jgi:hypothetical protein
MKEIIITIENNLLLKEQVFLFKKKKIINLLRIRNKIIIDVGVDDYDGLADIKNSILLLESITGFKTQVLKFYFFNLNVKNRFLDLNVILETLLSHKYFTFYLSFLFIYFYNYSFVYNKLVSNELMIFNNFSFNKNIFFLNIVGSFELFSIGRKSLLR